MRPSGSANLPAGVQDGPGWCAPQPQLCSTRELLLCVSCRLQRLCHLGTAMGAKWLVGGRVCVPCAHVGDAQLLQQHGSVLLLPVRLVRSRPANQLVPGQPVCVELWLRPRLTAELG